MTTVACAYRHTLFGLIFAIVGIALGIFMASTHNHVQHVTHAHILLLGLVVSLLYASVLRLWMADQPASWLITTQLLLHQIGTLVVSVGLFALYGQLLAAPVLGPILGIGSLAVLGGMLLMLFLFVRAGRQVAAAAPGAATGQAELVGRRAG